jgi:hypothetical protein
MGKGGEMSRERPELPARTDFLSWSDVAEYRPPGALLGYHAGATERAFALIARTIAERDAEIDWLRKRLAEVQPERAGGVQAESAGTFDGYASDLRGYADAVAEPAVAQSAAGSSGAASAASPAEPDLPATETWTDGGGPAGSGVAGGYSAHQSASRGFGEDE